MRVQDVAVVMAERATDNLVRNVRAMPEDKIGWKPAETARTMLDVFQECAQSPMWFAAVIENRGFPEFNEEEFQRLLEERKRWDTIDKCERVLRENSEKLYALIRDFPDSELATEIDFPFKEGLQFSFAEVLMFMCWHLNYHIGQICYAQTMYGDMEMH